MKLKKLLLSGVILSSFLASNVMAINTGKAPIKGITAYANADADGLPGSGEVAIWMNTGITDCPNGTYLNPSDAGFKQMLALTYLAYALNQPIYVQIDSGRWAGTSPPLCEANAIVFHDN